MGRPREKKKKQIAHRSHSGRQGLHSGRYTFLIHTKLFRNGNLGNSSTRKARLQEEVRLVELAQSTRVRYTGMGVFSAGAGNQ